MLTFQRNSQRGGFSRYQAFSCGTLIKVRNHEKNHELVSGNV